MKGFFGAPKQRKSPDSELTQAQKDRREFLKRAGAIVAGGIIGGEIQFRKPDIASWLDDKNKHKRFDRFKELSPKEREQAIKIEVNQAGAFLRSPEGKRILESGTDDEIFALLTWLPALLREHIADTSYDIPKENWPSVAVGVSLYSREPYAMGINYGPKTIAERSRGNGVFVAPDTILTNWHVITEQNERSLAALVPSPLQGFQHLQKLYESQNIDAVYIRYNGPVTLESPTSLPTVLPLPDTLSDAEVSGNLVTVAGIDPDKSSDADGTKVYPSIAIPVTRRLRTFLEQFAGISRYRFEENGFMYIAPPGESAPRPYSSKSGSRFLDARRNPDLAKDRMKLMQGTSGSPVLMNGKLVGINHRLGNIEYKGVGLDVGFFHGPDALRKARGSGMEISVPERKVISPLK